MKLLRDHEREIEREMEKELVVAVVAALAAVPYLKMLHQQKEPVEVDVVLALMEVGDAVELE
jgi:hypothetical protein